MLGSAMSVAASGLRAMQAATDLHSSNIANAQTVGYSRQDANFTNQQFGGVTASAIPRFSATMATRISQLQGVDASATVKDAAMTSVSNMLSSASDQLSSAMEAFRTSLGAAADRPQDNSVRIAVAGNAAAMASQATANLNVLDAQVIDLTKQSGMVREAATQKMKELIDLNKTAAYDPSNSEIRNQQADVGRQLADLVGGEVSFGPNGQAAFSVNGTIVVDGTTQSSLPVKTGGTLGGLSSAVVDISVLRSTFSTVLGSFSKSMNELNSQGVDSTKAAGKDLFSFDGATLAFTSSVDKLALASVGGVGGEIARKMSGSKQLSQDMADLATTAGLQAGTAKGAVTSSDFALISAMSKQTAENGVNLDQETINLKNAQNYYAANAKVIETANAMMGTLINMKA
ncbi:MAG: flagellar basal body rod C-terminal domain-containing protein [Agitococcus sp.]|nr:flagellar basal body rod C-terminal domain-containing protein [Agitococcus sp.]